MGGENLTRISKRSPVITAITLILVTLACCVLPIAAFFWTGRGIGWGWAAGIFAGLGIFAFLFLRGIQQRLARAQTGIPIPSEFRDDLRKAKEAEARYLRHGDRAALDEAAAAWQRILSHPAFPAAPERFQLAALNDGGSIFLYRYRAMRRLGDLDLALRYLQQALKLTPPDSPDLPATLNNLGAVLSTRYHCTERLEDLEEAIRIYWQALNSMPSESPGRPLILTSLGLCLRDRYARTRRLEDLEMAIGMHYQALEYTPPDSPYRPICLNNLGAGLSARYEHTGHMEDLEAAINAFQQALESTPSHSPDRLSILDNLGLGLRYRYMRTKRLEDLKAAIEVYQQAVAATPTDSPDRPSRLNNLGNGLRTLYTYTRRPEDLKKAIEAYQQALESAPSRFPDRPMILNNLGLGFHALYQHSKRLEDLEEAIRAFQQAIALVLPDSPDRSGFLNNLGTVLRDRYHRAGQLEDLEEAIHAFQQAIRSASSDAPDRPAILNGLGLGLRDRYERTGNPVDLEEAIRAWKEAVRIMPPDFPDRSAILNNLGLGLHSLYARTKRLEDLEEAIRTFQQAFESAPLDLADRSLTLNNLGLGLHDRYKRTRNSADLEKAIRIWEQVIATIPADFPARPVILNNLGLGLYDRYARTRQLKDLKKAIWAYRQAIAATSPASPNLPGFLNNLGNGLSARYAHTGRLEDLEEAIRVLRQAVQRTPPDAPNLPGYINNLGNGLSARYARTGRLADLKEARKLYPERMADISWENLQELRQRDLQEAQDCYRQACTLGERCSLEAMLTAGKAWGHWDFERESWEEAVEAYRYAFQAVERLFRAQFSRPGKESWIRELRGVPARAAYACWKTGQPERAVEALESGRARLLGEALERSRRDLQNLEALGHGDLLERYRRAAERYQALQEQGGNLVGGPEQMAASRPPDWLHQMEAAWEELEAVIAEIQQVPGYETFMKTLTANQLRALAGDLGAPLVYLAATPAGGLALIVTGESVQAVELPELTETALYEQVIGEEGRNTYLRAYLDWQDDPYDDAREAIWKDVLNATCTWLGEAVMGPLVDALETVVPPEGQVILIPTGWLALLPLHAADLTPGPSPTGRRRYALDHYAFTYAPSAQALHHAREQARTVPVDSLLAVEDPLGDLRRFSTPAVEAAQALFAPSQQLHLKGEEARLERVRQAFPMHNVLYFFTHGTARFDAPLESALTLADAPLRLEEIFRLQTDRARLAVLAACESGVPSDLTVLDEAVSLPSGWMQAGVPGVVGTLWTVRAFSTAILMTMFFEEWRQGGLSMPQALRRAQQRLRDAAHDPQARAYFKPYLPEVIATMSPAHVADVLHKYLQLEDFSHPFYWAPFLYMGL